MQWTVTNDLDEFVRTALPLLEADPAGNTVALSVITQLRAGSQFSEDSPTFGWCEDAGEVIGAVFWAPPYELGLAVVPLPTLDALIEALQARGLTLPGVRGSKDVCDAFAARWSGSSSLDRIGGQQQRLYKLDRLVMPDPLPDGSARAATTEDFELLLAWTKAFHDEAGTLATDRDAEVVSSRIGRGHLWVWQTESAVVAMAGRNVTAAKVARIGPVYTPPEHRRHGYGAAVTAACTADALAQDAEDAVLFTDLANPTSNAIYQTIGYRAVSDQARYDFPAPAI